MSSQTVHAATCDNCRSYIRGIRFKCIVCRNYDLCENCFDGRGLYHGNHAFHAIKDIGSIHNLRVEPGYPNPYKQQAAPQGIPSNFVKANSRQPGYGDVYIYSPLDPVGSVWYQTSQQQQQPQYQPQQYQQQQQHVQYQQQYQQSQQQTSVSYAQIVVPQTQYAPPQQQQPQVSSFNYTASAYIPAQQPQYVPQQATQYTTSSPQLPYMAPSSGSFSYTQPTTTTVTASYVPQLSPTSPSAATPQPIYVQPQQPKVQPQVQVAPVQATSNWPIGVFYIRSKHSGLYMDAKGEGKSRGTTIIQWSHNRQKNQQWSFEAGGIIRCVHNGLVIDIKGGNGSDIHLWEYENKTHQQWRWDGAHISSLMNGQYLDVKGASQKTGASICIWKPNGGKNQEWELIRV